MGRVIQRYRESTLTWGGQALEAVSPKTDLHRATSSAWSIHSLDGWTAKRLSRQRRIHPWQRPASSYTLKPRYKARENQLWMDVYISVSPEFNEQLFYDPFIGSTGC